MHYTIDIVHLQYIVGYRVREGMVDAWGIDIYFLIYDFDSDFDGNVVLVSNVDDEEIHEAVMDKCIFDIKNEHNVAPPYDHLLLY